MRGGPCGSPGYVVLLNSLSISLEGVSVTLSLYRPFLGQLLPLYEATLRKVFLEDLLQNSTLHCVVVVGAFGFLIGRSVFRAH